MKKFSLLFAIACIFFIFSCKKDDGRSCTTCSSPETANFEICEESNGNASVNGQDTGTSFDAYISDLQEVGVECGK